MSKKKAALDRVDFFGKEEIINMTLQRAYAEGGVFRVDKTGFS